MKTYKGFNVPEVGEFVSKQSDIDMAAYHYCIESKKSDCKICPDICSDCLFGGASTDDFFYWNQSRKNGVKLEE